MKFVSKFAILIILICIFNLTDLRRIRRHRKEDTAVEYIKAATQGFLAGILGETGDDINSCLPTSLQGKYLAQDVEEKEDETKGNTSILEFIWSKLKFVLDLACGFKEALMSLFGLDRRRRRRHHRRIFLSKRVRTTIFDFLTDIGNWISKTWSSFTEFLGTVWENLKSWTVEKWNELKTWTKQAWTSLINGVAGAIEKAKALKDKVVSWIINKALPILSIIFKCAKILLSLISKVMGIVKAIANIVAGNVLKIVDMVINLICSYQSIIDVS